MGGHRQGEKGGREQSYKRKEKKNWKIKRQNQQNCAKMLPSKKAFI